LGGGYFAKDPQPPHKTTPKPSSVEWDESTHTNKTRKANAAFVVLARNGDLKGILSSMKQMEDRFNKKFNYPWIFLNDDDFSEDFKKYSYISSGITLV
jgi:alpha 1,2-mannosyltransferase